MVTHKVFEFEELEFIAVTAYQVKKRIIDSLEKRFIQNQMITKLKIESNPFAKVNLTIQGFAHQIRSIRGLGFHTRAAKNVMETSKSRTDANRAVCRSLSLPVNLGTDIFQKKNRPGHFLQMDYCRSDPQKLKLFDRLGPNGPGIPDVLVL